MQMMMLWDIGGIECHSTHICMGELAMEKPIIFPQCPCQVAWKRVSCCRMPSAGASSISHMPCHCYLLKAFVICIISMWQMGVIHSSPNKMNWAFKRGGGGHSCTRQGGSRKLNKSSDTETNKEVSRIWSTLALAMMWLPSPIRMWTGLDLGTKGLTVRVLQNKHCHTTHHSMFLFFFLLSSSARCFQRWLGTQGWL